MVPVLLGILSKARALTTRWTSAIAGKLDRLDVTVASRAQASVWTSAVGAQMDILSSARCEVLSGSGTHSVPAGIDVIWVSGCGGGSGGSASADTSNKHGGVSSAVLWRQPYWIGGSGADISYSVGAGGAGAVVPGLGFAAGSAGVDTTFGTLTLPGAPPSDGSGYPVDYPAPAATPADFGLVWPGQTRDETNRYVYPHGTTNGTYGHGGAASALGRGGAGGANANGADATGYGAGGGGAYSSNVSHSAGDGSPGTLIVEW